MRRIIKITVTAMCMLGATTYVGMGSALAASSQKNVALSGNTNSNLLSQSSNLGPANQGALMQLSIVLRTKTYQGQTLAQFVQSTEDPASPNFQKFINAATFKSDFAPSDSDVQQVVSFLQNNGFTVTNVFSNNLVIQATAPVGTVEKTFNVTINQYEHGKQDYLANSADPQVPTSLSALILGISGMTTFSSLQTHALNTSAYTGQSTSTGTSSPPPEAPMSYGPAQVRTFYNVNPLYKKATGSGYTIGIATLANFKPSDAYTYWSEYHVSSSQNRITVVPVDGGFPSGVHQPGAGETTLDVEQSGSMAPGAKIRVYEAPNTNPGFLDLFYTVAADDQVQTMSCSWGEWEGYETPAYHAMMDQAFQEGAAEGISMFASAGDSGAYDENHNQNVLAVDSPASDPFITAAGGTTYPGQISVGGQTLANFAQERVWGWDYLIPNASVFGLSQGQAKQAFYPVGGGGGVSSVWGTPWYQQGVSGASSSGRNVPDISLNADPFTGYSEYDTFGPGNTGWETGWGGTSFVAPQLAGITVLMDDYLGHPLGFLNPLLYNLAKGSNAYTGSNAPFHDITAGDNWYYQGVPGYDNGSGIGSLNVANLANALK